MIGWWFSQLRMKSRLFLKSTYISYILSLNRKSVERSILTLSFHWDTHPLTGFNWKSFETVDLMQQSGSNFIQCKHLSENICKEFIVTLEFSRNQKLNWYWLSKFSGKCSQMRLWTNRRRLTQWNAVTPKF